MNNKCTKYSSSDMMFYLRGKLNYDTEGEFQHHLLTCDECRSRLKKLRDAVSSMEESSSSRSRSFVRRAYVVAASVAAVIAVGIFVVPNLGDTSDRSSVIYTPTPIYNSKDVVKPDSAIQHKDSVSMEIKIK